MKNYFQNMIPFGKSLSEKQMAATAEDARQIQEVESEVFLTKEKVGSAGISAEEMHKRGQLTAIERIEKLVDPGTFLPLNSIYDPLANAEGTTGLLQGMGKEGMPP